MKLKRAIVACVATCMLATGLHGTASASVIGTGEFLSATDRTGQIVRIEASLAREDVQAQMLALGVDPADATRRVASLSDTELDELSRRLDELPAGGDLLAVIGIVFVVLLILEITGVTDIFKRV